MKALTKSHLAKSGELDNRELQDLLASMGMRMVPLEELTPLQQLENRLDRMLDRAEAAFDAGKDASEDIKKFSAVFIPLINEVRGELGQHRGRLVALENGYSDLAQRVTALEQSAKKAG